MSRRTSTSAGPARPETSPGADAEAVLNDLRRVVLALRVWAQEAEGVYQISGAQLFVLQKLAEEPEQTVNGLARLTMTSKSSVSVVISRLERRGLVRRRPSPSDGRSVIVTLTPAGRDVVERGPESPAARILSALERLPADEVATLARLFDRFVAELGLRTMEPRMLFEGAPSPAPRQPRRHRPAPTTTSSGG